MTEKTATDFFEHVALIANSAQVWG